jgi:hypothetical protein
MAHREEKKISEELGSFLSDHFTGLGVERGLARTAMRRKIAMSKNIRIRSCAFIFKGESILLTQYQDQNGIHLPGGGLEDNATASLSA